MMKAYYKIFEKYAVNEADAQSVLDEVKRDELNARIDENYKWLTRFTNFSEKELKSFTVKYIEDLKKQL